MPNDAQPLSLNRQVADIQKRLRLHTTAILGKFDPNADPIIIGREATVNPSGAQYGIAIGPFCYCGAQDGITIGRSSDVEEADGIAIGHSSLVGTGHTQSVAIGYHARTTKPAQIMLGAAANVAGTPYFVEIAGSGLVLKDTATGTRYLIQITSGALVLNTAP